MSLLAGLPNHWYAYTNLDLAIGPGSSREIDVIIVAEDRILVVDLKDWRGRSRAGTATGLMTGMTTAVRLSARS
ncbi:hypothetical protein A7E77_15945 (plasmid) [Sphingomonas sp. NIC1]|nr:hypothetical protein A7E77_15945 [Sphingomonas sp. NIC1]